MFGFYCPHYRATCLRARQIVLVALFVFGGWQTSAIARAADGPSRAPDEAPLLEDAALTDIQFVDLQQGWAVGDRGVIWHTLDSGATWQRQESSVNCRLTAVHFLDPQTGWIAGRFTEPYTHTSRGVLLRTRDGGRTWHRDPKLMLPGLADVQFFDLAHGCAVGDASSFFPTGAYVTDDGGRTWLPLAGPRFASWSSCSFSDPGTGLVVGRSATASAVLQRTLRDVTLPPLSLRNFKRVQHAAPNVAWAVADGARVLRSDDAGATWRAVLDEYSVGGQTAPFDLAALAVRGDECWVAGNPGSRVFHTTDGGRSWSAHSTGQTMPIAALSFVDSRHGWAAGVLGTVLATNDGGTTWRVVRRGGARMAVAAFFGDVDDVPVNALAKLCGDEGFLSTVEILARRDFGPAGLEWNDPHDRAHEALVQLGATCARTDWCFPAREVELRLSAERLVEGWNRAGDGHALVLLEKHLVRQIRTLRPDVILTHGASTTGEDPRAHLLNQVVLRAVEKASDAASYTDLVASADLTPWQVKKVYGRMRSNQSGSIDITSTQLAPRLGRSLGDAADRARALWLETPRVADETETFRSYVDRVPQGQGRRDLMSGISLAEGSDARRRLGDPPPGRAAMLNRLAQRKRNLTAILTRSATDETLAPRLLAEVDHLTAELDTESAARFIYELAWRHHMAARNEMAAEAFARVAERYPNSELAPAALAWLVRYYTSVEMAWQLEQQSQGSAQALVGAAASAAPASIVAPASAIEGLPQNEALADVTQARAATEISGVASLQERSTRAVGFAAQLQAASATLSAEPRIVFPCALAERQAEAIGAGTQLFAGMSRTRPLDAWRRAAEGEQWLASRSPNVPLLYWRVRRTSEKPYLDGKLDEAVWQSAERVVLASPLRDDAEWPATALLARDDEYLYFAVSCRKPAGAVYTPPEGLRRRDIGLFDEDRIELHLDLDRDRGVYYSLQVDHRGDVRDRLWHSTAWNPSWHLATSQDEGVWVCEAAIPWSELTSTPPAPQTAWIVGVERIIPRVGFQSWSSPASTRTRSEGFGLLLFDE